MGNLAENVIQIWADFVNQSNLQKLLGLYAPDSTMVPTFIKKILLNSAEIQEYFVMLSEWKTNVKIFEESFCSKSIDMGYLVNGNILSTLTVMSSVKASLHGSVFFSIYQEKLRSSCIILLPYLEYKLRILE